MRPLSTREVSSMKQMEQRTAHTLASHVLSVTHPVAALAATSLAFAALAGGALACARPGSSPSNAAAKAASGIRAEAIRAHMAFLADDALEGRHPASKGYEVAARYARAQLEAAGLKGGAADGAWFQSVPLRRGEALAQGSSFVLTTASGRRPLRLEEDYVFSDTQAGTQREITAPIVFAGFGVTAPEQGYDDYAGIDAKGKIVAILWNAPASFPATLRAHHAGGLSKQENAVAHGAVALIGIRTPEDEKRFTWPDLLREIRIGAGSLEWVDEQGRPAGLLEPLQVQAALNRSGAEALFAGEKHSLEEVFAAAREGKPPAFALGKRASIRRSSRHTPVQSDNVVALLPGSDPALREEYVVYTAHLDHLGIGPTVDGDSIYNGALDNAAGSAIVLEVARAFAALPQPPRRSALFVLVTGEEAGLLGSDYFAERPTVPRERIVANINLDGGATLYPAGDIIAWGEDHSSLKPLVRSAAESVGLEVSPDPFPEETIFIRSDQYSFVRRGVPAVFLDLGLKSLDPKINGEEVVRKWLVTDYHSPRDDMRQPIDFESGARLARVAFLVGHAATMQDARPEWNPGDFFGEKYGRGAH
jgi:hypothetical protein